MESNASRVRRRRKRRKHSGSPASTAIRTDISSSSRIVGGSSAGAENYPFMVALFDADDPFTSLPVCGE
jgi:secreted trypsin-like serine protease